MREGKAESQNDTDSVKPVTLKQAGPLLVETMFYNEWAPWCPNYKAPSSLGGRIFRMTQSLI